MAFTGNKSEKEVVKSRQLYTGLVNFAVIGVNPTKEELEKLKIDQKVGEYLSKDDKGNPQVRLDVWLKAISFPLPCADPARLNRDDIKLGPQKVSFFLTDKEILSTKSTKKYWINKSGRTTWADTPEDVAANPKMKWYHAESMRPIMNGEETITKFMAALANVDIRDEGVECRLDSPEKLIKGTYKELKDVFQHWKNNTVQLLLAVKVTEKGNFQDFFKDFFGRPSAKDFGIWGRMLKDKDNGLPAKRYREYDIQDSLEFQEYKVSHNINVGRENSMMGSDVGAQSAIPDYSNATDLGAPPF